MKSYIVIYWGEIVPFLSAFYLLLDGDQPMWTSHISSLIPLTTALILTCCSSDRRQDHSFEVEEIDGVLTAVNRGGPKISEELFVYEKVVELEQDESRPESLLNSPETFLFDEQGYYYVEDDGNTRVAVFDPAGSAQLS